MNKETKMYNTSVSSSSTTLQMVLVVRVSYRSIEVNEHLSRPRPRAPIGDEININNNRNGDDFPSANIETSVALTEVTHAHHASCYL